MAKILVVDDEQHIAELIKFNLEKEGFQVECLFNGDEVVQQVEKGKIPDLFVLDIMLPGMDGMEVCRYLRRQAVTEDIPIIMLTAKGEEIDKVLGLEMGADDYITKPFSPRELVARIKARLRRTGNTTKPEPAASTRISFRDVSMDLEKFNVYVRGHKQELTPKEFELLRLLLENPGKVFTRDYLLEKIWGYDYYGDSRTVDVHIRHLRQKIEADPSNPTYIETMRGVGYRFKE